MAADKPVISIVIPLYNAERWILETIGSVRAQTFPGWELVVVDDGSRDGGPAKVEAEAARDARIRLVTQANAGPAAARHLGAQRSGGEWILFLDADDLLPAERLSRDLAVARDNPRSHVIAGGVEWFSADGQVAHRALLAKDPHLNLWRHQFHAVFNFAAMITRREAYFASGGFSPDREVHYAEDYDYTWRLLEQCDYSQIDEVSLRVRKHDSNRSALAERTVIEHTLEVIRRAWRRGGVELSLPDAERLFRFWRLDPGVMTLADFQQLVGLQGRLVHAYLEKRPRARSTVEGAWERTLAMRLNEANLPAGDRKDIMGREAKERGQLAAWRISLRRYRQHWRR